MKTRHEPDWTRPLAWVGLWCGGVGMMAACVATMYALMWFSERLWNLIGGL
jgi:hypothetical protein